MSDQNQKGRKRFFINFVVFGLLLIFCLVFVGTVFWIYQHAPPHGLPSYQGKSLVFWHEELVRHGNRVKTVTALDAMWPASMPFLAQELFAGPSLVADLYAVVYRQAPQSVKKDLQKPISSRERTMKTLFYLHGKAQDWQRGRAEALPVFELIKGIEDGNVRTDIFECLTMLAKDFRVDGLEREFYDFFQKDENFHIRFYSVVMLSRLHPESAAQYKDLLVRVLEDDDFLQAKITERHSSIPNNKMLYGFIRSKWGDIDHLKELAGEALENLSSPPSEGNETMDKVSTRQHSLAPSDATPFE